ncbi:porin [Massilia sp. LXY-6]|uniref:porin n=1 Tax=Massilia sp. LXY-6 TaxID=3379823 RepID=UPI003EE22CDA
MKRAAYIAFVPLLVASACPVSAQTEVNLYGIIDAALVYSSNQRGMSNTYMRSGNLAASRLGFKGSEELGSGLQALFQLENGFEADTGAQSSSGVLFNRQAFVGLADKRYGSLTAGRQYTPYYQMLGPIGPTTALTGATGAHPGDIDALDTTVRSNNSLAYTTPLWSGLQMGVLYGFGEQPGRRAVGSTVSAALKYDYRQWAFALGYQKLNNGDAVGIRSPNASSSFTVSPVNAGYVSADGVRYVAAAARYTMGRFTFGANASNIAYRPGGGSLFTDTATFNTAGLLAIYRPGGAWTVAAGYSYTRENRANGIVSPARYQQLSLEQTYSFSKRTALYFLESHQRAGGTTLGAAGSAEPVPAVAVVGDSQAGTPSAGRGQTVLMAGLRHSF